MAKKKGAALKIRRKSWFKIFAPRSFREQVIGESLVDSSERLIGRSVKVSLSTLTGDMKRQGTVLRFQVTSVRPEGGNTQIIGYEILPATLKRHMRRGVKTIANSFECVTADGVDVRIKPLIFTKNAAKGGISRLLNKTAKFSLIKAVRSKRYEDLFNEVIGSRLQRETKERLNKLFPVRMLEIKALERISREKKEEEEEVKEEIVEEKKEEEKEEVKEEPKEEKPEEEAKEEKKE
ncbi:hypothetical protein KY345_01165 [Candidatus Woesearchaeota archaeon]|nr:hypothetical protein [Candidatus Woesearchaeota archaeon]